MTEDGLFRLGLWIFYVGFIKTNALSAIAVEAGVQPQEFFQIRLFHSFQLQEIFTGLQFLIQIQDREISEGRGQIVFFVTRFQIRLIESSAIILDCGACRSQKIKKFTKNFRFLILFFRHPLMEKPFVIFLHYRANQV